MLGLLRRCSLISLIIGGVLCSPECRADTMREAQEEAAKIVKGMLLPLADGTSMGWNYRERSFGIAPSSHYWHHSEFKWDVVEEPLTAADRLNGLTWKGTIKLTTAAYRDLYELEESPRCWSLWRDLSPDNSPRWSLQKVRGEWQPKFHSTQALEGNRLPTQGDADRVLKFPPCRP